MTAPMKPRKMIPKSDGAIGHIERMQVRTGDQDGPSLTGCETVGLLKDVDDGPDEKATVRC